MTDRLVPALVFFLCFCGPARAEGDAAAVPVAPKAEPTAPARTRYELDRVENGVIHLHAPTGKLRPPPLKTHLFETDFVGLLHPPGDGLPYVLLQGLACAGCNEQKLLFLSRADGQDPHVLTFPGKIRDKKTGNLLHESSGYFGRCLTDATEGFYLVQKERVDRRRHPQESVLQIEVAGGPKLIEKLVTTRRLPKVSKQLVKSKACQTIPGYERASLSFRVPHLKGGDEREKEEQEREKELEAAPEVEREDDPAAILVPE